MASGNSERVELAKFCCSRNWSKAIRTLDSLLVRSCTIQDLCNRAFCYSQLELHKHVIKDCDRALEHDTSMLQAYILKGHAYSALGRKDDAVLVWKRGYDVALNQSADLKQLLELEELLPKQNTNGTTNQDECTTGSPAAISISEGHSVSESETAKELDKLRDISKTTSESNHISEVQKKLVPESQPHSGSIEKVDTKKFESKPNVTYKKLSSELESLNKPIEEPRNKSITLKVSNKSNSKNSEEIECTDAINKNQKVGLARISKTKSISLDFRLSRGIAEVCFNPFICA